MGENRCSVRDEWIDGDGDSIGSQVVEELQHETCGIRFDEIGGLGTLIVKDGRQLWQWGDSLRRRMKKVRSDGSAQIWSRSGGWERRRGSVTTRLEDNIGHGMMNTPKSPSNIKLENFERRRHQNPNPKSLGYDTTTCDMNTHYHPVQQTSNTHLMTTLTYAFTWYWSTPLISFFFPMLYIVSSSLHHPL